MKIITIADVESPYLWDEQNPYKLRDADLILSCGDLKPEYLSFLATFTRAPVLYVHGNHDDCYKQHPPDGCICIEDTIFNYHGIRILGLGGSIRYKQGIHQHTESEMRLRMCRLYPIIWMHHGFDILLTHSPAWGINDGSDLPHKGFKTFCYLMTRFQPDYMIHGHTHMNYGLQYPRISTYGNTTIINAYERYTLEIP